MRSAAPASGSGAASGPRVPPPGTPVGGVAAQVRRQPRGGYNRFPRTTGPQSRLPSPHVSRRRSCLPSPSTYSATHLRRCVRVRVGWPLVGRPTLPQLREVPLAVLDLLQQEAGRARWCVGNAAVTEWWWLETAARPPHVAIAPKRSHCEEIDARYLQHLKPLFQLVVPAEIIHRGQRPISRVDANACTRP